MAEVWCSKKRTREKKRRR